MPTRPDPFPQIAGRYARNPAVAHLFAELVIRAASFAHLQDEFLAGIQQHRAAREGRAVPLTSRQQRQLIQFEEEALKAIRDLERLVVGMDDSALVGTALTSVRQQLELDGRMLTAYHADDQPMAERMLEHQRETLRLLERFAAEELPTAA